MVAPRALCGDWHMETPVLYQRRRRPPMSGELSSAAQVDSPAHATRAFTRDSSALEIPLVRAPNEERRGAGASFVWASFPSEVSGGGRASDCAPRPPTRISLDIFGAHHVASRILDSI